MILDVSRFKDTDAFREAYMAVSCERRQKIDRFRFDRDKRLCLGAGVLLGKALEDAGFDENSLTIDYYKNGKPYFPEIADRFSFNLSHSGTLALCVWTRDDGGNVCPIGCDVEQVARADLRVAKRFFSPEEFALLEAIEDGKERDDMFFRLWTLKESFIKTTGEGLSFGLGSFSIRFDRDEPYVQSELPGVYRFGELVGRPGYRVAWCYRNETEKGVTVYEY